MTINTEDITPVEKRGRYYFKRDDLYSPFDVPLNGSKVRQTMTLFSMDKKLIEKEFNSTVCTVSSIHSPQGYLIARCARHHGFRTIIGIGTSKPDLITDKFPAFKLAVEELEAEILPLAKIGFNSVLQTRLDKIAYEKNWYSIPFGVGMGVFSKIINSKQVSNIPTDLDHLVIPCGSGISTTAILKGISELKREDRPKKIHVVQIAGIDRKKVINSSGIPYDFIKFKEFPYAKKVDIIYEGIELDNIYESKAFYWMEKEKLKGKILFWIVGNFNAIRG